MAFELKKCSEVIKGIRRSHFALKLKRKQKITPHSLCYEILSLHPRHQAVLSARQGENGYFLVDQGAQNISEGSVFTLLMTLSSAGCSLCPLLTGTMLRVFAATTSHLLLFWYKNSPAPCWLANCQRAKAGKGFTLQPQRISGHIQTTEGQPGAVPYKKTIFWFWTLPSALKSSSGIFFLFDSLKNHQWEAEKRIQANRAMLKQWDYSYQYTINVSQETINS